MQYGHPKHIFLTKSTSICFTLNNTHEYVSFRKYLCLLCNCRNYKFSILICWHNAWGKWMNPVWIFLMGGKNNHGRFISWVYKCSFFSFTCVFFLNFFYNMMQVIVFQVFLMEEVHLTIVPCHSQVWPTPFPSWNFYKLVTLSDMWNKNH